MEQQDSSRNDVKFRKFNFTINEEKHSKSSYKVDALTAVRSILREKGERKVSNETLKAQSGRVKEVLEKYNWIIAKAEEISTYGIWVCGKNGKGRKAEGREGRRKYREIFEKIEETWKEIEEYFPVLSREEIVSILRRVKKGSMDFEKCVDVARILSRNKRAMRFVEIREDARNRNSFRNLQNSSMNRVLSRVLEALCDAGLVLKLGRKTVKGNLVDVYYFRLFRLEEFRKECGKCPLRMQVGEDLRRIINRLENLPD